MCVQPQVRAWNVCRMSSTFVTLAEVLEARGGPLLEEEVWSLLLGTAESLVDISYKGKMLVYSLGMTLYWSVDFHLPQNQPVQLSDHLNSLLLSMCEDLAHRRVNLNSILEACESQHKASILLSPAKVIRQLVEEVFHDSVSPVTCSMLLSRSNISLSAGVCAYALGPEFIRMPDEQQIVLELPGSIVSRKGRSCSSQREVTVVLPNGQYVMVRCDTKSKARDVFDMVVAHANLVEHFYFGLAFIDDDEYFFLDHETKISKVAPDTWKKGQIDTFLVFLRVKFFVDDISFILHRLTRHQYYLQLRKDILEDKLYCNEETGLFLAALALQAEFGDYMPEVLRTERQMLSFGLKIPALSFILALPSVKEELPRLHASHAQMLPEEAETEYLKVITQQLPEYGVMFHRVGREKRPLIGELVLGVCVKGIIVYEMKNHLRIVTRRFLWRETDSISTGRRKLIIECGGPSGKKHSFITESSKIAQYLLNLCSAQHKFHSEMTSRQLNHSLIPARNLNLKRMSCSEGMLNHVGLSPGQPDSLSKSCDDINAKLEARLRQQRELRREMSRDLNKELAETGDVKERPSWSRGLYQMLPTHNITNMCFAVDTPTRTPPEREIICVTLKKDPKLGFGFVIVGEDNTGKLDLGIFIASIVPDGPADKDGRIKPGGRLISLNKTSLEGVTFSDAAAILQSSPEEVELIVSQPKRKTCFLCIHSEKSINHCQTIPMYSNDIYQQPSCALKSFCPPGGFSNRDGCSRSPSILSLKSGERLTVELKKSSGSLGISVAGGTNTSVRFGGIYIKSLVPGGAAEQDGRIQIGDRLLEVDGSNLRGVTHQQAVECLKRTGEVKTHRLVLEPRPDSPCPPSAHSSSHTQPPRTEVSMETTLSGRAKDYSFVTDENTHEVVLKKSLSGLGFSFYISHLHSGPDRGSVVRIKRLFPGQPALESGQLREGDVILSVNKEPVKDLSYQRVLFLLRGAPSEVHLLICRPGPGVLYDVDDNTLSPAPIREVRSRSLDIRLGEDYSQLLKFNYDINIPAQKQPPTQEEDLTNTTEKSPEPPPAPGPPPSQESPPGEAEDNKSPPSPPRSPPSPTSPTSPPTPISPASPASPASPTSPPSGSPQPRTESIPCPEKTEKQQEKEAEEEEKDGEKEAVTTSSTTVMLMDVCPKSSSSSVYAR
uniref:FERM and PDZ domain containing 2 n=1 Tax=Sphaeramia orbicularis TaxID=375764 RepID=A0A672ZVM9_9TELE